MIAQPIDGYYYCLSFGIDCLLYVLNFLTRNNIECDFVSSFLLLFKLGDNLASRMFEILGKVEQKKSKKEES